MYDIPAGGVELDESIEVAACRETFEETAGVFDINPGDLLHFPYILPDEKKSGNREETQEKLDKNISKKY